MYLFYCDESNLDPASSEFFVYGGVAVPGEKAAGLSSGIEALRVAFNVPRDHLLKFNPAPAGMAHADFVALKRAIVELAAGHDCVFIANLVLHGIARDPAKARRFGVNTVLYHYDCLLGRREDYGIALIDRFCDEQIDQQLRDRFAIGVTDLPHSPELRLERILGFHYSAIGQAHFATLVDIVIGAFRYSVNCFTTERHLDSARTILEMLQPLFLGGEGGRVASVSLQFNPVVVKAEKYKERYESLQEFLKECGIAMSQEITDVRAH